MTFKTLFFSLVLLSTHSYTSAQDITPTKARRNLCDDMIESGKSTDEQIKKCLAKMGESELYRSKKAKQEQEKREAEARSAEAAAKKANIETKKFSVAELTEAAFGKAFYAISIDYKNRYKPKEERVTTGDALCKYLGYEKALKTIVSPEIMPLDAHKNGLIIDTNFFGKVSKEPELYEDEKATKTVRKYVEITCAKVMSVEVAGTAEELSKVVEDLVVVNAVNTPPKDDGQRGVNDGSRKPSEVNKTPNSFKTPDWMKDDVDSTESVAR